VIPALFRASASKHPDKGLIAHSNQGSQYSAHDDQNLLQQFGMIASMSRKANCHDNPPMESFWGLLKTELLSKSLPFSLSLNKPCRKLPNSSKYSITDSASKKN